MNDALKRGLDVAGALMALILVSPLMLLVALLVFADLGRPVLFRQVRVGRGGGLFTMVKFRTMREANDADGKPLPDSQRVTLIGRLLRRFRLDETPELLAVLSGRLSLVGPRPLPPDILASVPRGEARTAVRPGLTGLAQISGNTLLSNAEKAAIDLFYIRHRSLGYDLAILARTIVMLLFGSRRDEALIARALAELEGAGARPAAAARPEPRLR